MKAALVEKYFPELSKSQQEQIDKLGPLYQEWNSKINVISRKDIDELYLRHVLHSCSIASFIRFEPGSKILDAGTGGGFPGIPLAILFPKTHFVLVDSIGKKIKVVREVANSLGLGNLDSFHQRAEKTSGGFDFVVTRAVARSRVLWNWTHQLINPGSRHEIDNGIIALKGGDLREELNDLGRPHQITDISDYFEEEFFETKKIVYIPR